MYTANAPGRFTAAGLVPVLFTATVFLSAGLLFFVQPLFAHLALPRIGGAPAVWTTAMLFFQSVLIAGYLYAHLSTRYLRPGAQVALHAAVFALALSMLPLALPAAGAGDASRPAALQTLLLLAGGVGLPFFLLSANAPLVQAWYARSGAAGARDPYFLYAASNLGSLLALLGYPLVAQPLWGTHAIATGWSLGFLLLGAGLLACGMAARAGGGRPDVVRRAAVASRPGAARILRWTVLAFVPSSLMLAVTTKIATDFGAIPMVWVVPLALYLLTFVVAFSRRPVPERVLAPVTILSLTALALAFSGLLPSHLPMWAMAGMMAAFFAVALTFHQRLHDDRPDEANLTMFYLVMSCGGALGGLFNSLVAPVAFDRLHEGALTLLVALAVLAAPRARALSGRGPLALAPCAVAAAAALLAPRLSGGVQLAALAGLVGLAVFLALRRLLAGAMLAAALALIAASTLPSPAVMRERSFFGTHVVSDDPATGLRVYGNGTTVHGAQRLSDLGSGRPEPLYYYHRNGPMGQVMASARGVAARHVGVVGLGTGSLACYARAGQAWEFYEIDPVVDRIARDPALFGFMPGCAGDAPTHLGDARLVLAAQERQFDLLFIDAFSSDTVPVHLMTHEAMRMYLDRVSEDGIVVYHVSNRYYDLERPLGPSVAMLGAHAVWQDYPGRQHDDPGDSPSRVVLVARSAEALAGFASPSWQPLPADGAAVWTDDHANLLSVLRGRGEGGGR
jgi:hypothetical protein